MKQVTLYNTITHEGVSVELSNSMVDDLEHTVLVSNYETFRLVSTIPGDVKQLREYEQKFEDNEFKTIYESWFNSPSSFEEIAEKFEERFTEYFNECAKEKYPELDNLDQSKKDSVCLTLRTRFLAYLFSRQNENNNKEDAIEESGLCFGKDYSKKMIDLFKILSLDDPMSIQKFSDGLADVEKQMLNDKRRRAGFDTIMLGITATLQDIAGVFINDPTKESVNLVEAFKNATSKDRLALKDKLEAAINKSCEYYKKFLTDVDDAIANINRVDSNKSMAYLRVMCKIVSDFMCDTNAYVSEINNLKGHINVEKLVKDRTEGYRRAIAAFSYAIDMLMVAYDSEGIKDDLYGSKVVSAWRLYDKEKSSDNNTWYFTLARGYTAAWEDLFGCIKDYLNKSKKDEKKS